MVGVIIGGSLAGIAGMFLAIPIIAILKVVFDRIPSLVPFGYLMGENKQKSMDWNKIRFTKMFSGGKKKEENKSEEDE
jgi:hypothetical protein